MSPLQRKNWISIDSRIILGCVFAFGIFIIGCKSSDKNSTLGNKGEHYSLLQGYWLSKDYIKLIKKNKSPLYAYDGFFKNLPSIVELDIDTSNTHSDTLLAGANINNHEGGQFAILLPEDKEEGFIIDKNLNDTGDVLKEGRILIKAEKNEPTLYICDVDSNGRITNKWGYTRINKPLDAKDDFSALNYFVRKELFDGKYRLNNQIITFYADGRLDFPQIHQKYYEVLTDMCCPTISADVLMFENAPGKISKNCLGFKLKQDSLLIYDLIEDTTISTYTGYGHLKYSLVKVKN